MKRLLSGIQPTGNLHLGNYLGAVKNWVQLVNDGYESFIFIANLHSITMPQDPRILKEQTMQMAASVIACGLDPKKCTLFIQSTLPEHSELAWILSCVTPVGWMNKMTQFKEKAGKHKENASAGLFVYPILQSADILIYQPDFVPVGEDQKQHIEITRDIAQSFNRVVNREFFKIPDPMIIGSSARIKSLRDGSKKMSKSDESDYSRINLNDDPDTIMLKFKKAKSDSIEKIYFDKEKRPEISNLLNIYAGLSARSLEQVEAEYADKAVSSFKQDLADLTIQALKPIRETLSNLVKDKGYLAKILDEGGARAKEVASINLSKAKELIGLI